MHICMLVGTCVWVCMWVYMSDRGWWELSPISLPSYSSRQKGSPVQPALLASLLKRSHSHHPRLEWKVVLHSPPQYFRWVLGIQTPILILAWQVLSSLSNFRSSSLFVFIPSSWYLGHSVFVEMSCYILEIFILELCYQTCSMKYWLILTGALWFWGSLLRNRSKERSNWQLWRFWELL